MILEKVKNKRIKWLILSSPFIITGAFIIGESLHIKSDLNITTIMFYSGAILLSIGFTILDVNINKK